MLIYILCRHVHELAMVCHAFSQYICLSLSVLSCFGVIDCSQDINENDQKKPTYVCVFFLVDFENKCKTKCYYIFFLILGANVLLTIIWFKETVKVREWNRFFFETIGNIWIFLYCNPLDFFYLACPSGYFGINCLFNRPYPFFGRVCTQKCNCSQSECDFIKGCQREGKTFFTFNTASL